MIRKKDPKNERTLLKWKLLEESLPQLRRRKLKHFFFLQEKKKGKLISQKVAQNMS